MEIKKSYELRQVGKRLVLRKISGFSYEMETIRVADELVPVKDQCGNLVECVGGMPFFVLRADEDHFLCWEKQNDLQIATYCQNYEVLENSLLLERYNDDCDEVLWHWWSIDSDARQLYPLGKKIFAICPMFIIKDGDAMSLIYFEDGVKQPQTKRCFGYEVLVNELQVSDLLPTEFFEDVLKLDTEEGELFVSIEKETGPSYPYMGGVSKGKVTYHFTFAKEKALELTEFTHFANATCEALGKKGLPVPVGFGGKSFNTAEMREKMHNDVKITISVGLLHMLECDVDIEVNISKLYRKENQAYWVECKALRYYKSADDVRVEKTPDEHALYITADGITDKIFCKGGYPMQQNDLTLMANVCQKREA